MEESKLSIVNKENEELKINGYIFYFSNLFKFLLF